jgi:hypothetical protein
MKWWGMVVAAGIGMLPLVALKLNPPLVAEPSRSGEVRCWNDLGVPHDFSQSVRKPSSASAVSIGLPGESVRHVVHCAGESGAGTPAGWVDDVFLEESVPRLASAPGVGAAPELMLTGLSILGLTLLYGWTRGRNQR